MSSIIRCYETLVLNEKYLHAAELTHAGTAPTAKEMRQTTPDDSKPRSSCPSRSRSIARSRVYAVEVQIVAV
jgi:hypothetical protein